MKFDSNCRTLIMYLFYNVISTRLCKHMFIFVFVYTGYSVSERECNIQPCRVNSYWSWWNPWSECSSTCKTGTQYRSRTCIGVAGVCHGADTERSMCHGDIECPGKTETSYIVLILICNYHTVSIS